jgi:hypothetical protein
VLSKHGCALSAYVIVTAQGNFPKVVCVPASPNRGQSP